MRKRISIILPLVLAAAAVIAAAVFLASPKAALFFLNETTAAPAVITDCPATAALTAEPDKTEQTTQTTAETAAQTTGAMTAASQPAEETFRPIAEADIIQMGDTADGTITLGFTGDINLDETWKSGPMQYCKKSKSGIRGFIKPDLIKKMNDADILFVNNEFTYSTRGDEQLEKAYTFRADPKNVEILKTLGVDVVSIANNHIYDFRKAAMADTISTLKKADIACVGGGENLAEAMKPAYFRINGKIIAYVAASCTLWYYRTPAAAGENTMGVLDAFGNDCIKAIKEAAANSDYVVVYLHWGNDYQNRVNSEQITCAKKYIDAGADAVIGAHPHVLQGMDYYKGKFIAYSLGNFWFNIKDCQTGFLELVIDQSGKIEPCFTPCRQVGSKTYIETDMVKRRATLKLIEDYSPSRNIVIHDNGVVEKTNQ